MQNEYEENLRLPVGFGMGIFHLGQMKHVTDPGVREEEIGEEEFK